MAYGNKLAVAFDEGRGVWLYDAGGGWSQITTWDAYDIESWGSSVLAAFEGQSLYRYDGATWIELTTWEPEPMTVWNDIGSRFSQGPGV